MEEKGYPKSDASLKKGPQKDAAAYSEKAGAGAGGQRKGAKLDKMGGAASGRDEKDYKEHCKDE